MLAKANQAVDKKMSNVEVKGGTQNFGALFSGSAPKAMKLSMPAIAENSSASIIYAPTTENLSKLER